MSPRGVADPHTRELLLDAADRILEEDGPSELSVRRIAREAGVASGALYNYFADRDELLTALIVARFEELARRADELASRAGERTLVDCLAEFGEHLVRTSSMRVADLIHDDPALMQRVHTAVGGGDPVRTYLQGPLVDYLRAEQAQGRVRRDVDLEAAAFLLLAAWHQLLLFSPAHGADAHSRLVVRTAAETLVAGLSPHGG